MNAAQKKLPGRPVKDEAHRDADRKAMVDAAFGLLSEGGPGALTARAVAERTGSAVGKVYLVFPSLEALRQEANVITMGMLRDRLASCAAATEAAPVRDRLLALADTYIAFSDEHRPIWAALFEPCKLPAPPANAEAISGLFVLLEGVLRQATGIDPDEAPILARALWSSVHGTVYLAGIGSLGPVALSEAPAMVHALVKAVVREGA